MPHLVMRAADVDCSLRSNPRFDALIIRHHVFCYDLFVQEKEFVIPDDMSKYRLCEIADGGHFFVHNAEGGDLALIEAKLKELKDKVGRGFK